MVDTLELIDNEQYVVHDDAIQECIYDFCIKHNLDGLESATQNLYTACLLYIQKRLFSHGELKQKNGYYDIEKVSAVLDYYVLLTLTSNKVLTQVGFCSLTGISKECLLQWSNIDTRYRDDTNKILTNKHYAVTEKLRQYSEESVQSLLTDGRKNPVGAMAILNHRFGWNVISGVNNKPDTKPQLTTRDELDRIAANDKPLPLLPDA